MLTITGCAESSKTQPTGTLIYYIEGEDGAEEWAFDAQTQKRRLINRYFGCEQFTYTPDRSAICFVPAETRPKTVYMVDAKSVDSDCPKPISSSHEYIGEIVCSPDGNKIAYVCMDKANNKTVHIATAGMLDVHKSKDEFHDSIEGLTWSPDATHIAFYCWDKESTAWSIHIMDASTGNERKLGVRANTETYPCWSPDGVQIAYHTEETDTVWHIAVVNADGSGFRQLTREKACNWMPLFSPDGKKILFWSNRTGAWQSFLMNCNGSDVLQLTRNGFPDNQGVYPAKWAPSGAYVSYQRPATSGSTSTIYVVDMDGHEFRVAGNTVDSCWSPEPVSVQNTPKKINLGLDN